PWNYLGWWITQDRIRSQPLKLKVPERLTLNDVQQLLGAINWLRSIWGLPQRSYTHC
ncbi:POK7 protein, partial [Neodrepanis coruscans]|nr:POK7 protein [Neodrepanis coruscans]